MATPAESFDAIAAALHGYCDAPEVVIRVEMDFDVLPHLVSIVRHIRDPDNLFDRSRDTELILPADRQAGVRARVRDCFEVSEGCPEKLFRATLSVYQEGLWSIGETVDAR